MLTAAIGPGWRRAEWLGQPGQVNRCALAAAYALGLHAQHRCWQQHKEYRPGGGSCGSSQMCSRFRASDVCTIKAALSESVSYHASSSGY